ncbi:alpha-(1,6)-fucosyltransferase-like isoform X5 [Schistocerca gregaria]|uniref:alpha-(1,6)-fucosyltransferase-like isoform X4 n=1 Tax=Schistocerca gregaria TaxID=7010 RepID=UPI00211EACF8|nr:alpha-(1,6)-fucosyltransferase-like isoform X4 [Schistocerca gregaria]XP_049842486.1 alpha-(1,6)-fucosyltransferase-like isoform X5 [Schistocerca gregaria]
MATASYLYHPCHTIPDRPLQSDIDDQAGVGNYEVWWECEATQLSDLGQRQLHSLENPQDCNIIRKFICTISKSYGCGCQCSTWCTDCFYIRHQADCDLQVKRLSVLMLAATPHVTDQPEW